MLSFRALGGAAAIGTALLLLPAAPAAAEPSAEQGTWHGEQAHVPDARAAGRAGAGVVVAVLDSWVDGDHEDFGGRVLPGADCLGGSCAAGPAAPDDCDHGTHVAGTVAASSFGVAPRATVLPVRVLSYDEAAGACTGRPADVTAGIRWAVRHGARVLNLSLGPDAPGLSASSSIQVAVDEAVRAGALVVVSAGNASLPVTQAYGASALVVAATGPDGALASYSQRGVGVDLAAPGGDPEEGDACRRSDCVTSLFPGDRYSLAAGTSMAAPHVSGVAALLLGQDPGRSRQQVLERLLTTAAPLAGAGRGLLDARAALAAPPAAPPAGGVTAVPPVPAAVPPVPPPAPARPSPPAAAPAAPSAEGALPVRSPAPTPAAAEPLPVPPSAPAAPSAPPPAAAPPVPPSGRGPGLGWAAALAAGLLVAAGSAAARSARRS